VDRAGLRRKLLKAQAEAGDVVLLFGDESEALTHPYLAHAWAKQGADLRVSAPGQAAKVAMLGVFDWARRDLVVRTSRTKRSSDVIALLSRVPRSGQRKRPVIPCADLGGDTEYGRQVARVCGRGAEARPGGAWPVAGAG